MQKLSKMYIKSVWVYRMYYHIIEYYMLKIFEKYQKIAFFWFEKGFNIFWFNITWFIFSYYVLIFFTLINVNIFFLILFDEKFQLLLDKLRHLAWRHTTVSEDNVDGVALSI